MLGKVDACAAGKSEDHETPACCVRNGAEKAEGPLLGRPLGGRGGGQAGQNQGQLQALCYVQKGAPCAAGKYENHEMLACTVRNTAP